MSIIRWVGLGLLAAILLFGLIQLVPYGHSHANPPVSQEPNWDAPQTRELAVRGCYDCHSNEAIWPWYSNVAPVSWLIQHDVADGRRRLNFSDWGRREQESDEIERVIRRGDMPPWYYVSMHPTAKLTPTEQETLIRGLTAIAGGKSGSEGSETADDDD